jgi:hypothetical protein
MIILLPRNEQSNRPVGYYWRALSAAICIAVIGCRPADQIRSYNMPKQDTQHTVASLPSEPTDRMLVAILPDGDKAWFFKVVGPQKEIAERADRLQEFFASIRPAADKPHPEWQLPDDWNEQPGTGMRAATILVPTNGKPLELSVTSLPWTNTQEDLLDNINRWRGQLQLAPIDSEEIAECKRELAAGDVTLTIVDLLGRMQGTDMTPPLAAGAPVSAEGSPAVPPGMPSGHPSFSRSSAADNVLVEYERPAGWELLPASGIRKAAFRVVDDAREAQVTVIDFPATAGPMIADPLANVNRWRSEVGLEPLAADDSSAATKSIEIAGLQASYIEAIPDASQSDEPNADTGTLAAMATSGDVVWFFKITGDRSLVVAQRDQFKSFLRSVEFTIRDKSNDGN